MHQPVAILLNVIFAIFLGCKSPPPQRFFMVHYTPKDTAAKTYAASVRVKSFDLAEAYQKTQIAYRLSPFEIQYYNYRLWGIPPNKGFSDLLCQHFREYKLFEDVMRTYTDKRPEYEIDGDIMAIEEYDEGTKRFAHLSARLRFLAHDDKRILVEHVFDRKEEFPGSDPEAMFPVLSEIYRQEVAAFITKIEQHLGNGQQ